MRGNLNLNLKAKINIMFHSYQSKFFTKCVCILFDINILYFN